MPSVATIIFYDIASISEIVYIRARAKGLRLHKARRTRGRSSTVVAFTKKKNHGKIKTTYRKLQRNFKPKFEKVSIRVSILKQPLGFTANHLISMMNLQG
jgi:hypothetical protein